MLVRDQKDSTLGGGAPGGGSGAGRRVQVDWREMAEEQGWVARMVHLFRSDDLGVQFEVSLVSRFKSCFPLSARVTWSSEPRRRVSKSLGNDRSLRKIR